MGIRPWEAHHLTLRELDALAWADAYALATAQGLTVDELVMRAQGNLPEDREALVDRLKRTVEEAQRREGTS